MFILCDMIDITFCGQIALTNLGKYAVGNNNDANYAGIALALDSPGLGVFDAFFASLSMIIVSEVSSFTPWHISHQMYLSIWLAIKCNSNYLYD